MAEVTVQQIKALEVRAMRGDLAAQSDLGLLYGTAGQPAQGAPWLARAAAGGFPPALRILGLWRLAGFGVPQDPKVGANLMLNSARAGDADATHFLAAMLAGGIAVPRNVPAAIQWLARAARWGHPKSCAQLALLMGLDGSHAASARALMSRALRAGHPWPDAFEKPNARDDRVDWDAAPAAVDLSWTALLPPRTLHEDPRVVSYAAFLPVWACRYLIGRARPGLKRGMVGDGVGGEAVDDVRTNTLMHFGLGDTDVIIELINAKIAEATGLPVENQEALGVLHYAPGERYAPHVDYIDPGNEAYRATLERHGQRARTLLVYLNDGFEGGETEFSRLDLRFKGKTGDAVMFDNLLPYGAPDPRTLHAGLPPAFGEKWLLSKWIRTTALRPGAPSAASQEAAVS